ncbi:MAG: hypothetical protein IJQ84_05125 [Paludibacteraceae bacterium]|nr:hypothetical protein [Paludibacteraceae bacterium]
MTYHTNIRHQELVALLGTRNLYLRLVYAHIANYTQVKGAWCGSQRDLADQLELPIATVSNQLTELINRGLIVRDTNAYRSTHEQKCSPHEQKCSATEQKSDPIINNEIMKSNEIIARDTIATPDPTDQTSFERFLFFFRKRVGNFQMTDSMRDDCRNLWDHFPLWKRLRLFETLNDPNGWFRPRLDWTLTAFNPQPVNLNGTAKGGELLAAGQAKTARYNGSYGLYSLRDIEDFALPLPPQKKK